MIPTLILAAALTQTPHQVQTICLHPLHPEYPAAELNPKTGETIYPNEELFRKKMEDYRKEMEEYEKCGVLQ